MATAPLGVGSDQLIKDDLFAGYSVSAVLVTPLIVALVLAVISVMYCLQ